MLRAPALVPILALLVGCAPPPSGLSPTDLAEIKATTDRWVAAVRTQRWEDAAATFTDDAILWFGGTPHAGRVAIRSFLESMPPWDSTRMLHIDEIHGGGNLAFVAGHSTIVPATGGAPVIVGRYLDIRMRQADGSWRFFRDMVTPLSQAPTPHHTNSVRRP